MPEPIRTIELTDPRAMRAYAHPVRLELIGLLRRHGPMTATQAAVLLGESSGTCSFHFRQLEKYGFCEAAGGGKGREKPWRATAMATSWASTPEDPRLADAEQHLNLVVLQRYVDDITRWLADRGSDPPEWREALGFGDVALPLTRDELAALRSDVEALVRPYLRRLTGNADAPPGARRVRFVHFEFPDRDDESAP